MHANIVFYRIWVDFGTHVGTGSPPKNDQNSIPKSVEIELGSLGALALAKGRFLEAWGALQLAWVRYYAVTGFLAEPSWDPGHSESKESLVARRITTPKGVYFYSGF